MDADASAQPATSEAQLQAPSSALKYRRVTETNIQSAPEKPTSCIEPNIYVKLEVKFKMRSEA